MSDVKLPPQKSDTDTSNWDERVLTAPKVTSVNKIIKNKERREMILNSPERKRPKYHKNPDIIRSKN
jgi:hypothetical protein